MSLNEIWPSILELYNDATIADLLPHLVVAMDALNQLIEERYGDDTTTYSPSDLKWLPNQFPPKVKVILSAMQGLTSEGKMLDNVFHKFNLNSTSGNVIVINPLSVVEREKLVRTWHMKFSREVDVDIMQSLWEAEQCANPMFLSLALNYLILSTSSSSNHDCKATKCKDILEVRMVPELIVLTIRIISETLKEKNNGFDVVKDVLCLTACSSSVGLTITELAEIIKLEKKRIEDIDSWRLALRQIIAPRRGYFNFTHDYVRKAVEELFFADKQASKQAR